MTERDDSPDIFLIVILAGIALGLSGCSNQSKATHRSGEALKAVSRLQPTTGNSVNGTVSFEETEKGIHIVARLSGLTPGDHGFHIHAKGDCSSNDGKSAGGHFNPHEDSHGKPHSAERHVGDLSNITADANGNAKYNRVDTVVSFGGVNRIIGKGIIIHARADDLTSQPTGAAGPRIACGVIELAVR